MKNALRAGGSGSQEVDHRRDDGRDDNPEQLEPVEEGEANKLRFPEVIERGPE